MHDKWGLNWLRNLGRGDRCLFSPLVNPLLGGLWSKQIQVGFGQWTLRFLGMSTRKPGSNHPILMGIVWDCIWCRGKHHKDFLDVGACSKLGETKEITRSFWAPLCVLRFLSTIFCSMTPGNVSISISISNYISNYIYVYIYIYLYICIYIYVYIYTYT